MGVSTSLVGLLPATRRSASRRRSSLIVLRLLQGLALGGEYGGAATYVAEHAPPGKRGLYTSWIQTTATLGLFLSLLVILALPPVARRRSVRGLGLAHSVPASRWCCWLISVWIRLQLQRVAGVPGDEGRRARLSKAPLTESFAQWANLKIVLLALFGATAGQAVVWYSGQFYALFFLTQTLQGRRADGEHADGRARCCSARRSSWCSAALSDRIGRKTIILAGCCSRRSRTSRSSRRSRTSRIRRSSRREQATPGHRRRRSGRLSVPVRSGRQDAVHDAVRRREGALAKRACRTRTRPRPAAAPRDRCAIGRRR